MEIVNLDKNLKKYVMHIPSENEKSNFMVLVFLLPAMFVLIPIFAPPFEMLYAVLVLPPFIAMAIIAVWYRYSSRNDGKKYQNTTFFFIKGLYGVVASVGSIVIIQKLAYGMLGIKSPLFFILSFLGYGIVLYFFFRDQIKKVYAEKSKKNKKKRGSKVVSATASTFSFLGYLVATMSLRFVSDNTVAIVLICGYIMISYIMMYHMFELHRYFLIRNLKKNQ